MRRSRTVRLQVDRLEDRSVPSFGSTGIVLTDVNPSGGDYVNSLALQPDGDIVAAGSGGIVRYQPDGSLDATFNASGSVPGILPLPGTFDDVVLQGDGKIVAAGYIGGTNGTDFLLRRFNPDGSADSTFGVNGVVTTGFKKGLNDYINAVAIQSDGKIVAVGQINFGYNSGNWAVARYNSNGSLDTTFGKYGWVTTTFSSGITKDQAYSVVIQPDGRIVAAGYAYGGSTTGADFGVVRYNSNGSLDTTFGSGGKKLIDFAAMNPPGSGHDNDTAYSVALQGDGKIVVGGGTMGQSGWLTDGFALARLNANGSLDSTFGAGGTGLVFARTPIGDSPRCNSIALQPDGKIVAAGDPYGDVYVARFDANGSMDPTFGSNGWQAFYYNPLNNEYDDSGYDALLQPDGKIVVAGGSGYADRNFALARLNPDGSFDGTPALVGHPLIGSFTSSAATVAAGDSVTLTASGVTDSDVACIVMQVAFYAQVDGVDTLLGYGTYGGSTNIGTWTFTFTVNLAPGTYTLFAQAKDNFFVLSDPVSLTLDVI